MNRPDIDPDQMTGLLNLLAERPGLDASTIRQALDRPTVVPVSRPTVTAREVATLVKEGAIKPRQAQRLLGVEEPSRWLQAVRVAYWLYTKVRPVIEQVSRHAVAWMRSRRRA